MTSTHSVSDRTFLVSKTYCNTETLEQQKHLSTCTHTLIVSQAFARLNPGTIRNAFWHGFQLNYDALLNLVKSRITIEVSLEYV